MFRILKLALAVAGLLIGFSQNTIAGEITVMDQIGPNPTRFDGRASYTSQIFEPIYAVNNIVMGVMAIMPITTGGVIGVYSSSYNGTPSDFNAFQVNPGGYDNFPGDIEPTGQNAAYRILAQTQSVPEPSTLLMAISAAGVICCCRFWRARQKTRG